MWVYLNDRFLEQEHANISVFDHGFLYGDGIFETLRVFNKQLLFLDRHLARLDRSCKILKIQLPTPEPNWPSLFHELLERNNLDHTLIRLTISRGVGGHGPDPTTCQNPTVVIFPRPLPQLSSGQRKRGVDLLITKTRRHSGLALPQQLKSLNYLNNILAKQEALSAQVFDGVMLNLDGYLAECSTSNLFFVKKNKLYTPSFECGILPGIT